MNKPISILDTECYPDYWLARFSTGERFQMYPGVGIDTAGLYETMYKYQLITFNGINYDIPMITLAIAGATCEQLKTASDMMIVYQRKHWQMLREWSYRPEGGIVQSDNQPIKQLKYLDHIDLFEVAPGTGSLKAYGAKMHAPKLQDLPYDPNQSVNWAQRALLAEYCGNDLDTTGQLHGMFSAQLQLRADMSEQYHVNLMSKSDAQIAEAVMKSLLPFEPERPYYPPGMPFYFRAAPWLKFETLNLLQLLEQNPFYITDSGGVGMTETLEKTVIRIGTTVYKLGIGGLHSQEESVTYRESSDCILSDHDVASYYPSLILRTGIYPAQIGSVFIDIYKGWYDTRIAAKKAKQKKIADSLKTNLNGTFGKLNSIYSIFYAPTELIQVTLTGQLALLMLIECFEQSGIQVISANTDGIVLHCRRDLTWLRDDILRWWEGVTQFETEETNYKILAMRDVNSYIAIRTDGEVKLKGAFAPPIPGPSGWPNPTGQICVDAIVEMFKNGVAIEQTIRECTDIRQFIYARSVTGGAVASWRPLIPKPTIKDGKIKTPTKRVREELCAKYQFDDYVLLYQWSLGDVEYIGKVVRWYYGKGSHTSLRYSKSYNLVPRTIGCVPCMQLPETLPPDIDYEWYINETKSLLADLGL